MPTQAIQRNYVIKNVVKLCLIASYKKISISFSNSYNYNRCSTINYTKLNAKK